MFKLGETSGLAASADASSNENATTLQEQNNQQSVMRKMMEYALDSFGVQNGDGGSVSSDPSAYKASEASKLAAKNKVGTASRQGVGTAEEAAKSIPGCPANIPTKSGPIGGAGTVEDLSRRQLSGELTPEELASESLGGTTSSWLDVLKDGVSTVAEFSGNVVAGIRDDFCNTQPFPECARCPHRKDVGSGGFGLQIPDFLGAISAAIDALLGGAIGAALDQILCPGVLGSLQRGDLCALNAAVVNSGVRTLVASTISAGSPSMYNTLLSVMPTDIRMVMGSSSMLDKLMCSCTSGGGMVGGYGSRNTKPIPRSSIIQPKSPLQQVVEQFTGRTTSSQQYNARYGNTPSLSVKPGNVPCTTYNPLTAIITGKGSIIGTGVTRNVNTTQCALNPNPVANYKNSIYTGSVGSTTAGANVSWFDEMVNTLIMTGTSGDTLYHDTPQCTRMYETKYSSPGQHVPGGTGYAHVGCTPRAATAYGGRTYNMTVGEKVAVASASIASIIVDKQNEKKCKAEAKYRREGYAKTASRCPSTISASTPAISIKSTRTATNSPAYRMTQLPGTTVSTTTINTAIAIDREQTGRPGPVDTRGCGMIHTDVDQLVYK